MSTTTHSLHPHSLGLPFPEWREYQAEALVKVAASPKRIVLLEAPTGAGKSGIAVGAARILGSKKSAIVCSTLQLQDQYLEDIPELRTVKGRGNFGCLVHEGTTADMAPCTVTGPSQCEQYAQCPYYVQKAEAVLAPMSIHNYSYWLRSANSPKPEFSNLDFLALDETHKLIDELTSYVCIELSSFRLQKVASKPLPDYGDNWEAWRRWALTITKQLRTQAERRYSPEEIGSMHPMEVGKIKTIRTVYQDCLKLTTLDDDWLISRDTAYGGLFVQFRPVWPAKHSAAYIFSHAKKTLMMSATILNSDIFCSGLGINMDDVDFFRLPSTFPKARRPVYPMLTTKVSHGMSEDDTDLLIQSIDSILEKYPDSKGLIHCVNYTLCGKVLGRSKYAHRMVTHKSKDRAQVLSDFKDSSLPLVLLSPSMTTGVDLPDDECRFIIIAKLPFANKTDPMVAKRMKIGPDGLPNPKGQKWYLWSAACDFVQSLGRGMRSPTDFCATYILDANWKWFRPAVWPMLPEWVKEAVQYG